MSPNAHARYPDSDLAPLLADFYEQAPPAVQTRMLRALLRPVGPLAMVAVAAGAFARLLPNRPSQALELTPEVVHDIHGDEVFELARYVEQKCPEVLQGLPDTVGNPPQWASTVSGTQLLGALKAMHVPQR